MYSMNAVMPSSLVMDTSLSPQTKLTYAHISATADHEGKSKITKGQLANALYVELRANEKVTPYKTTASQVEDYLEALQSKGYIEVIDGYILLREKSQVVTVDKTPKKAPITDEARRVLKTLSDARIVRGYGKVALSSKADLQKIQDLLGTYTVSDLEAVIACKFEDEYFQKNHSKYLQVSTLFRSVERVSTYLTEADTIEGIRGSKVAEYGLQLAMKTPTESKRTSF